MVAKSTASDQPAKMAHSAARRYELPRGFTGQLLSYRSHSSSGSELNKLLLRKQVLSKTPWPTLSKAGCMERVCKVLSIRYNSKMASHLLYKCQRAPQHLSGGGGWGGTQTKKEQEFTTGLNTPVKQRPLCARAFCSKCTLEKFGIIFFAVVFYIRG